MFALSEKLLKTFRWLFVVITVVLAEKESSQWRLVSRCPTEHACPLSVQLGDVLFELGSDLL